MPLIVCPTPEEETVCGGEHEVIVDTLLLQVNVTVTLVLFHPAEFAAGEADAEMVGSACSRFTMAEAAAVFPATSVVVPDTGWLAPSLEIVVEVGQVAIPDNESLHVKLTVTGLISHPLAFGAGESLGITVGGVLSMLRLRQPGGDEFPCVSIALAQTAWLAPSELTSIGAGQILIGKEPPVQVKVTVTYVLFQPAALGAGEGDGMMVGGVAA